MAHLVRVARLGVGDPTIDEEAGALLDAEAFDDLHWLRKAYAEVHKDPKK